MVEIKVEWTEKNVKEFVKYTMFTKGKAQKILTIAYAVCFLLVFIFGVIAYFVLSSPMFLIASGAALLLLAAYFLFMELTASKLAKSLYNANKDSDMNIVQLSAEDIIVCRDHTPVGRIPWATIAQIDQHKNAVYLTSSENALLLLEKERITGGTAEELEEIIKVKNAELSKTA